MSRKGGKRPSPTPLYKVYSGLTRLAAPMVLAHVGRKLAAQGVEPERIDERAGHATLPRPEGEMIWFHGASVGESLSVLSVITRLGQRLPGAEFLMTSGTASSAQIVGRRLPPRTRHQFAPMDAPQVLDRFLDHWRPRAGVFVESELWPGMLIRARDRGVKLALLNARLSARSAQGWARYPDTARFVLDAFGRQRELDQAVQTRELEQIAELTGGRFFRAKDRRGLELAYEEIERLERTRREEMRFVEHFDLYPVLLLPAFGIYLASWLLALTLGRRLG